MPPPLRPSLVTEPLDDRELELRKTTAYKVGWSMEFLCCFGGNTNPLGNFCIRHKAHTFNLYVAQILFWAIALPQTLQTGLDYSYGYKGALKANDVASLNGKLQSGRFGSGAFPMIFICCFIATGIFFQAMYEYATYVLPTEDEDDAAPVAAK